MGQVGCSSGQLSSWWENLGPWARCSGPPPPLSSLQTQYILVAMAMASQREVGGIGQEQAPSPLFPSPPHIPGPLPTRLHPAQLVGSGRKRWGVRGSEEGWQALKGREKEVKDGERAKSGGSEGPGERAPRSAGVPRPSCQGVRSGSSSLRAPTGFWRQQQQVAKEEGPAQGESSR